MLYLFECHDFSVRHAISTAVGGGSMHVGVGM